MLDSVTRKRLDDLRDILVGKVPDPTSQVEQITNGLIYKFMYDMDQASLDMGGVASFFSGEFAQYAWGRLFDPKLGGAARVRLYSEAIERMYTHPSAPPLFREMFKNSFLPFKDPVTLGMFLKRINEFNYLSDSEQLGDAYEYLLSFMGAQGDAGQFRTPRHIIDFIVAIISPQKQEAILDPACSTAGFLIAAYKHILQQNTNKRPGDRLTAAERQQLGRNLVGYDIAPDKVRLALVNMYLHHFASPQIYEYDTLSSDARWHDYFDVILANPPFFSPKGGIRPHSRFGVRSKRAEVLFVDYIMEHLRPAGRAGIIVPEGIIFQTGAAYKTLRKKLVEDYLIGVISLPAGVFKPYSGVKTSILILDRARCKRTDRIFFAKVENDGFSLGDQRTPIDENDLPDTLKNYQKFCSDPSGEKTSIARQTIIDSNDYLLSFSKFQKVEIISDFEIVELGNVASVSAGNAAPQNKALFENGKIPFVRTSDVGKVKFGKINAAADNLTPEGARKLKVFPKGSVLFPKSGASTLLNHRVMLAMDACVASHLAIIRGNEKILSAFLFYMLLKIDAADLVDDISYPSLNIGAIKKIKIPLPPIDIQREIVAELEGYQQIINRSKKRIHSYTQKIQNRINRVWGEQPPE